MKHLRTYNESLRDQMVAKSKEEILDSIINSSKNRISQEKIDNYKECISYLMDNNYTYDYKDDFNVLWFNWKGIKHIYVYMNEYTKLDDLKKSLEHNKIRYKLTESLKDQMKGKSEEDLINSLGEKRYTEYVKLSDVQETLNKRPFGYSIIRKDQNPMFLNTQTELNDFQIEFIGGKYVLSVMGSVYKFNTKNDLINEMKNVTLDSMDSYEKDRTEEINNIHKEIKDMKEEILQITKNF